jgi:flavorubredoxin
MAGLMEEMKGMNFKNKKAAAFGAYGWSGEAPKQLDEYLKAAGFTVVQDSIKAIWTPDEDALENCRSFGRDFVAKL